MKKLIFTLLVAAFACSLYADQVPRNKVVIEIGTATW
jgi:hypothetical protein